MLTEVERFQPPEPDPVEITLRDRRDRGARGLAGRFARSLAVTGMTRDQLRRYIRDDLRSTTYLNQRFGASRPTPDAARRDQAGPQHFDAARITVLRRSCRST